MGGGSSQTIGFRYFMGLHMAICYGPVDTVHQVYVAKRAVDPDLAVFPVSGNSTVLLNNVELFGGDEKEGGILGDLDLEFGGDAQVQNSYLVNQLGVDTPAFRGVTCAVFRAVTSAPAANKYTSPSTGGFLTAMTPYPKPWAFEVTDIPGGNFNITKQNINGGANGGHIIYDCLTDPDWGLGLSDSGLDLTTFTTATDALFAEGFSLSMIYAQQSSMEDFVKEVLTHINGVLYTKRDSGKYVLKLIRDDFDINTVPEFNETNISSFVSFERPAFAELVNEITIKYRVQGDFEDSSLTAHDLASIQAQEGIVSQTSSFPGIDDSDIAARVGQRELKQLSTPLARIRIIVNREGWDINPGDVIKISWGAYGIISIAFRVSSVDYGTLENGLIGIDAVEDVFGLPANTYLKPISSDWAEPIQPPVAAPSTLVKELPHFVVETTFAQEQLNALLDTTSILQAIAEFPSIATLNIRLNTRIGAGDFAEVSTGEFSPTALLTGALDKTTKLAIPINSFKGGIGEVVVGGYGYLNNEVLRIDSVDLTNNLLDVGRGYLDSLPQSHSSSSIIYFVDDNNSIDPTFYDDNDVVDAKVLTQTSIGTLALADAVTDTLTMTGRRLKPYNGAQIQIAGSYFPTVLTDFIAVPVTWEHQDRTQQLTVAGQDWYEVSLGAPEAGTTYTVRYYNNDTATLLFTDTNINGRLSSFTPATAIGFQFNMRVEVESIRDGVISNDLFSHIFSYTKALGVRTLENTNTRTLENGDRRVLEG